MDISSRYLSSTNGDFLFFINIEVMVPFVASLKIARLEFPGTLIWFGPWLHSNNCFLATLLPHLARFLPPLHALPCSANSQDTTAIRQMQLPLGRCNCHYADSYATAIRQALLPFLIPLCLRVRPPMGATRELPRSASLAALMNV